MLVLVLWVCHCIIVHEMLGTGKDVAYPGFHQQHAAPGKALTCCAAMLRRNAALPSVFLGFRQREAFDADLAAPFPGATSVYTWQGQGYRDYYETYFQVRACGIHDSQAFKRTTSLRVLVSAVWCLDALRANCDSMTFPL